MTMPLGPRIWGHVIGPDCITYAVLVMAESPAITSEAEHFIKEFQGKFIVHVFDDPTCTWEWTMYYRHYHLELFCDASRVVTFRATDRCLLPQQQQGLLA